MISQENKKTMSDVLAIFASEKKLCKKNDTISAINKLIEDRNLPLSENNLTVLENLCRKLDVARRLCNAYDNNWKKPTNESPVSQATLLASALCLARFGKINKDSQPEQLFKWLNAAFNAVKISEESSPKNEGLTERVRIFLETYLDERLDA